jgi:CRISPR/Cas system-associated exonuclease Cas4 (RecB family)
MASNFFEEHGIDAEETDVGSVWYYDGDLDLNVSEQFVDGGVEEGLPHISKSRIKTFLTCPRKFGFKYLAEMREPSNFYMERGSAVHDTYEKFHQELEKHIEEYDELPDSFTPLTTKLDSSKWFQFLEYIGPFFRWELKRLQAAQEHAATKAEARRLWEPHSVERELKIDDPPVGEIPWLGPYDALVHAASVPAVSATEGWVVVDYKTGSVKKEQYQREGIHIDLEFYAWMLEEDGFDVAAGVGMYPTDDENVVREMPNEDTRETIESVVSYLHAADPTVDDFPVSPGPLCDYCYYQDQCPTTW